MNFVRRREPLAQERRPSVVISILLALTVVFLESGCSDGVKPLSPLGILEFNQIGPDSPHVDVEHLVRAKYTAGPYRVVPGDVLELTIPSILQLVSIESAGAVEQLTHLQCRIGEDGTVSLPIVGNLYVAGRSLAEIEKGVVNAYYPAYTQTYPAVFARVAEFKKYKVSISGAVVAPGVYDLRGDQMSLMALLEEAQGIIPEGASVIHIERDASAAPVPETGHLNSSNGKGVMTLGGPKKKSISLAAFVDTQDLQDGKYADVNLSFLSQARASTIGTLSLMRLGRVIVQERLDLSSEAQRLAVLNRATQLDPSVSIVDLNAKLTSLVSLLREQSVRGPSIQLASANIDEPREINPSEDSIVDNVQGVRQYGNRSVTSSGSANDAIVLPVKGTNIPFADVALREGDRVVVEKLNTPLFAVMGLVRTPGNYEYPPGAQYNLLQAIAFAGGLNPKAEPRYVSVYRTKSDGSIARAVFQLKKGSRLTDEMNIPLKPGDVVSVEHTPRTRRNEFIRDTLHFSVGTYISPQNIFDPDTLFNSNNN